MMILAMAAAIYGVATAALYWIATKLRGTVFAWPYAFVVGAAAAWAMEFATEIQLMQTFGVIPGNQPWPVVTWGLVALAAIAIAGTARPSGIPIAIPCAIIAALALQHGIRLDEPASTYAGILTALVGLACLFVVPKQFADELPERREEGGESLNIIQRRTNPVGDDLFRAERKLERRLLGPFSVVMILWAILAVIQVDWWLAGIWVVSAFANGLVGGTLAKNRYKSPAQLRLGSEGDASPPSIALGATSTNWSSEDYRVLARDCHRFAFVVGLTVVALCIHLSVHAENQSPGSHITWWITAIAAFAAWFLAIILAMFVSALKWRPQ